MNILLLYTDLRPDICNTAGKLSILPSGYKTVLRTTTGVLPWFGFDPATRDADLEPRKAAQKEGTGRGGELRCRACRHGITRREAAVPVHGKQVHVRTNPSGITFEFGCYSQAPGCAVTGQPTGEHSWFPGHTWQIAHCTGCGAHLGWRFRGSAGFFGLILDRLIVDPD